MKETRHVKEITIKEKKKSNSTYKKNESAEVFLRNNNRICVERYEDKLSD